jgi:dTDP-4-amino-4,6-dideoxygalactose transaminase
VTDRVPLADPVVGDRELDAVAEVLESGYLADGPTVREFEAAFADHCGAPHAVAVANGTAALVAALRGLGVGPGDAVVTTPLSFVATANAVRLCGATPVFADVDPETYNLDPEAVHARVEARDDVVAVLAVHLYGLPAAMDDLRAVADDHGLALVEDAAQAHGATHRGDPVGSLGDVACFSFYPTKNMTTGEGGMVLADDESVARRARRFVDHGRGPDGAHLAVGHNFRLTSVAAAMGLVQLDRLPGFVADRRRNAALLDDLLADAPVETPVEPPDRTHAYHQYTVRAPDRDGLRRALDDAGVDTGVYYPTPIHEEPAYDGHDDDLPVAERAAREVLSLPVHPGLSEAEVRRVGRAVVECAGEVAR